MKHLFKKIVGLLACVALAAGIFIAAPAQVQAAHDDVPGVPDGSIMFRLYEWTNGIRTLDGVTLVGGEYHDEGPRAEGGESYVFLIHAGETVTIKSDTEKTIKAVRFAFGNRDQYKLSVSNVASIKDDDGVMRWYNIESGQRSVTLTASEDVSTFNLVVVTEDPDCVFVKGDDSKYYWYEGGVKQGTYSDANGVVGDGTVRGREIFDPATKGWYWLDACYDGAKAVSKEVWMPYIYQQELNWSEEEIQQNANASDSGMAQQVIDAIKTHQNGGTAGKWVRYDANGAMYKGWCTITDTDEFSYCKNQVGNTYYYDTKTGLMAKGWLTIEGKQYHFDETTGVLDK